MIYLIIKVGFDTLENHNPITREIVGYCDDKESAERHIDRLNSETEKFVPRYEHTEYPYFEYKEVNRLG